MRPNPLPIAKGERRMDVLPPTARDELISIDPADFPVYERKGDDEVFWQRTPVATIAVTDVEERNRIVARRWGQGPV